MAIFAADEQPDREAHVSTLVVALNATLFAAKHTAVRSAQLAADHAAEQEAEGCARVQSWKIWFAED